MSSVLVYNTSLSYTICSSPLVFNASIIVYRHLCPCLPLYSDTLVYTAARSSAAVHSIRFKRNLKRIILLAIFSIFVNFLHFSRQIVSTVTVKITYVYVTTWSTVDYTSVTSIMHCRPCCNKLISSPSQTWPVTA